MPSLGSSLMIYLKRLALIKLKRSLNTTKKPTDKRQKLHDKAVSATYRIWNKQNYSIEYQNDTQKEYFTFEYPTYRDFDNGGTDPYACGI